MKEHFLFAYTAGLVNVVVTVDNFTTLGDAKSLCAQRPEVRLFSRRNI